MSWYGRPHAMEVARALLALAADDDVTEVLRAGEVSDCRNVGGGATALAEAADILRQVALHDAHIDIRRGDVGLSLAMLVEAVGAAITLSPARSLGRPSP